MGLLDAIKGKKESPKKLDLIYTSTNSQENKNPSVQLKVVEALQNDVGRSVVRLDSQTYKVLKVTSGDIVELEGKRVTAAVVWQAHSQDEGQNVIRMDGYLRQNAGVDIGDMIFVRKAQLKEAMKVTLAPNQSMRFSPDFAAFIKGKLKGRAITRGDTLYLGILGSSFPLIATVVEPAGIALVSDSTEVEVLEAPTDAIQLEKLRQENFIDKVWIPTGEKRVKILKKPKMKNYVPVETALDIQKLAQSYQTVMVYEDDKEVTVFCGPAYYTARKKKKSDTHEIKVD